MNLFRKRTIPVNFTDYPSNLVDTSLFDTIGHADLTRLGLKKSPLNLIHSAAIHYNGRFRNSKSLRFINAFIDIFSSIGEYYDGKLYLNNTESNEFQKSSSEVIAVGICIETTSELFNINKNRIDLIEGTKKRCDFRFIKGGYEYIIESKGRKGRTSQAINDIFAKKQHYPSTSPKYGVVSSLPRNGQHASVTVVDPEFEPRPVSREETIKRLLSYYSKLSYLAGFWRMGDLLAERVAALDRGTPVADLDGKELDYGNIIKFGNGIDIKVGDFRSQVFFPKDTSMGFRKVIENKTAFFPMEQGLVEILSSQNFSLLEEYRMPSAEDIESEGNYFSLSNDGSILMLSPTEFINTFR